MLDPRIIPAEKYSSLTPNDSTDITPTRGLYVGVSGDVKVISIDGEVSGDLIGGEKVVISKSGRVRGNIVAPRMTLEDGALFKGSIDMDPGDAAPGKVSLAASTPARAATPAEDEVAPGLDLKSG